MPNQTDDSRTQRALAQLRVALNDPAIKAHLDDETHALISRNSPMLVGGPIASVEAAANNILSSATRIEYAATHMASDALRAATSAAEKAASSAIETATAGFKETVDFVHSGSDFVFGGPLHMAVRTTETLVKDVFEAEEAKLQQKLEEIAEHVVEKVPFAALIAVMLEAAKEYEDRFNYVLRSFAALAEAAAGNVDLDKSPEPVSLGSLKVIVVYLLRFLWNHSLPGVLVSLVNGPHTLAHLFETIFPIPKNLPLNFLHVWLTQKNLDPEELEFRKQLIACIDQFVRDQQSIDVHLAIPTGSRAKTGLNLLSDFFSVVFSLIGGFTFRHRDVPSLTIPKLHWTSPTIGMRRPFDGAHVVSTGVSRSVSYSIKSIVATVGRGAWEVNAHNDALIEGVSSALSSFIGTLLQSMLNDVFWSLQIREIYDHQKDDMLLSWDAVAHGSGEKVLWGVSLRTNVIAKPVQDLLTMEIEKLKSKLKLKDTYLAAAQKLEGVEIVQVLQSYTAYMDAIRDYTDHHEGCDDETIAFTSSDRTKVVVTYTCAAEPAREPVLRAYCHGQVAIMKPGPANDSAQRTYACSFNAGTPKSATIHVRSNWGASANSASP